MNLTEKSLEEAIMKIASLTDDAGRKISLRPTKLIVPTYIYNNLMYKPPIKKAKGIRGRKRALMRRGETKLERLLKEKR